MASLQQGRKIARMRPRNRLQTYLPPTAPPRAKHGDFRMRLALGTTALLLAGLGTASAEAPKDPSGTWLR